MTQARDRLLLPCSSRKPIAFLVSNTQRTNDKLAQLPQKSTGWTTENNSTGSSWLSGGTLTLIGKFTPRFAHYKYPRIKKETFEVKCLSMNMPKLLISKSLAIMTRLLFKKKKFHISCQYEG